MEGGDGEGGNEEGDMGRGETGREGKEEVQAHGMTGLNKVTVFLTLLSRATPGTPASLY